MDLARPASGAWHTRRVDNRPEEEQTRIERIAGDSWYASGPMPTSLRYLTKVFARHWSGPRCLELGPAEGITTEALAMEFSNLTLVDGSARFCSELSQRYPTANVVRALFEEFTPTDQFDTIVLGHVLEHVVDPVALLRRVRTWCAPGGVVLAAVPNSHSLHRQAAVRMGLLTREDALNETDLHHGHRRVYDLDRLTSDFRRAGHSVIHSGGYWLKPLSNAQLQEQWTQPMLDAYMELGELYPEIAAEIYLVSRP